MVGGGKPNLFFKYPPYPDTTAKTRKRIITMKEITNSPAKTNGTSNLELAAIIRYPVPSLLATFSEITAPTKASVCDGYGWQRPEDSHMRGIPRTRILEGEEYDLGMRDALLLLGQVGMIRIGNLWTASAKIEKSV